jgi:predicted metal-dependent HD superfamily phosphohydrolase
VPEPLFRPERRKILAAFLKRPRIYHTEHFFTTHESRARENLQRSLSVL